MRSEIRKKVITFLRRQCSDIREGGLSVLLRKVAMTVEAILAVPLVLFVRLIRPLVLVRFGGLPTDTFGPLAGTVEAYLCECELGLHGRRVINIFCVSLPVCNAQLTKMWKRALHVTRFARSLERVNRWLPGGQRHRFPWGPLAARDIHGTLAQTKPHLSFTKEEERRGYAAMRQLGIPEGVPFVCFQARDQAYMGQRFPHYPSQVFTYRNSALLTFLPAADELTRRGYLAVRVGAVVETALNATNPRVIDYAVRNRTDFLDIFLEAHCRFYLGDTSGIAFLPMIFRRPIALVNFIPLEYVTSWGPQDLFIPKRLWLKAERRFLTFPEILESGVGRLMRSELYERAGLEIVDNTPEEIVALVVEMDERLKGTWQTTEEDEQLQCRFWALFQHSPHHKVIRAHIGAAFLRAHCELLGEEGPVYSQERMREIAEPTLLGRGR